jgi:hypothetical protein
MDYYERLAEVQRHIDEGNRKDATRRRTISAASLKKRGSVSYSTRAMLGMSPHLLLPMMLGSLYFIVAQPYYFGAALFWYAFLAIVVVFPAYLWLNALGIFQYLHRVMGMGIGWLVLGMIPGSMGIMALVTGSSFSRAPAVGNWNTFGEQNASRRALENIGDNPILLFFLIANFAAGVIAGVYLLARAIMRHSRDVSSMPVGPRDPANP